MGDLARHSESTSPHPHPPSRHAELGVVEVDPSRT